MSLTVTVIFIQLPVQWQQILLWIFRWAVFQMDLEWKNFEKLRKPSKNFENLRKPSKNFEIIRKLQMSSIFQLMQRHNADLDIVVIVALTNLFIYFYSWKMVTQSFENISDCLYASDWQKCEWISCGSGVGVCCAEFYISTWFSHTN